MSDDYALFGFKPIQWRNVRIWREPIPQQWRLMDGPNDIQPAEIEVRQVRYVEQSEVDRVLLQALREIQRLEIKLRWSGIDL